MSQILPSPPADLQAAPPQPMAPVPPSLDQLWAWLGEVPDPEIPVVSIVDLGIVRGVAWSETEPGTVCVTVTPTYSGCPATDVIGHQIREELQRYGIARVELKVQLSPAWTTDWLTERAKQNLRDYGIAPPIEHAEAPMQGLASSLPGLPILGQGGHAVPMPKLLCPRCGSDHTEMVSRFGSTPCKSLHRCLSCLEPFDHFKCH